jgi:hypothetical protein
MQILDLYPSKQGCCKWGNKKKTKNERKEKNE